MAYCINGSVLSNDKQRLIKSTFNECDLGKKGFLDREDLKIAVVQLLGYKPSKVEIDHLVSSNKSESPREEKDGVISLQHFIQIMENKMATADEDDEIRQTFLAFDSKCHGFLTVEDLKKVFGHIAPHMQTNSIEAAFREIDRDGDGRVSYKDFEFMMKYNTDDGF